MNTDNIRERQGGRGAFVFKVFVAVLIVAIGAGAMLMLIKSRKPPKTEARQIEGTLVDTLSIDPAPYVTEVTARGTVLAAREVSVVAEVSATATWVSERFVNGGFFEKNELIMRLDDTDYRLALRQAEAALVRTQYELEIVRSKAEIARAEWNLLQQTEPEGIGSSEDEATPEPHPLVLYKPQVLNAEAAVRSSEASVEAAKINIRRTEIRAPFACRIRQKSADLGQHVRAGSPVATVAATDYAEIIAPIRQDELDWIQVPGYNGRQGSEALIRVSGLEEAYRGRVVRTTGEVDAKTRSVSVVITVDDPYALRTANHKRPLLQGSFVEIAIKGRTLEHVFVIARSLLHEDGTLWIMNASGQLEFRPVTIARLERDRAVITNGLDAQDRIVSTPVSGATQGMKLRTRGEH